MKFKISLFFALFLALSMTAQEINFTVKVNTTSFSNTGGNNYQLVGTVIDDNGVWSASNIAAGDSLFYIEESIVYPFIVNSRTFSGFIVTAQITSVGTLLSSSPSQDVSGQVAVCRKNANGYCAVPSGLQNPLSWALENRFKAKLATDVTASSDVYAYLGGAGVLPSASPPTIAQYLARNTAGELYQYNPLTTTWALVGGAITTGDSTNISLVKTGAGIYKGVVINESLDSSKVKFRGIGASDLSQQAIDTIKNPIIYRIDSLSSLSVTKRDISRGNFVISPTVTATSEILASAAGAHDGSELNTGFGADVFHSLTGGFANTAVGRSSLYSTTSGRSNTAIGNQSLYFNTTGNYNTVVGNDALASNTTGVSNIAMGEHVGGSFITPSTGNRNTFLGHNVAFGGYTTASDNNIMGFYAGENLTTGSFNTLLGSFAGRATTTQNGVTAIGYEAGMSNTADNNTFIGYRVGRVNSSGYSNTGIGTYALYVNTTGAWNSAIGYQALNNNTTGSFNYASGADALHSLTTGNFNLAIGNSALYNNISGSSNTAIGSSALTANTGSTNTAIGNSAGLNNVSGSGNLFLGYAAGTNELGSNKLYIANSSLKTLIYGDFSSNRVGINTTTPLYNLDIDANTSGTGNPIRLQGLNVGSTTDSVLTSLNGVVRRLSIDQVTKGATITQVRVTGITGTTITFTGTNLPSGVDQTHIKIWKNGLFQEVGAGNDYQISSTSPITLTTSVAAISADKYILRIE